MRRLSAQTCTLTVVGSLQADPAYTRRIQRQAATSQLAERVHFCGPVTGAELAKPAEDQPYPVRAIFLRRLWHRLPGRDGLWPAASPPQTAGGAAEIITDGQDGFLIPPEDVNALAGCLAGLQEGRHRLLEMSLAARRRYQAHPTWSKPASAYGNLAKLCSDNVESRQIYTRQAVSSTVYSLQLLRINSALLPSKPIENRFVSA